MRHNRLKLLRSLTLLGLVIVIGVVGLHRARVSFRGFASPQGPLLVEDSKKLVWDHSYLAFERKMDWSPYDYLELTLNNLGNQAVSLRFEVKDEQSNSYWT